MEEEGRIVGIRGSFEDATPVALKMTKGPRAKECLWPRETGIGEETELPWASREWPGPADDLIVVHWD